MEVQVLSPAPLEAKPPSGGFSFVDGHTRMSPSFGLLSLGCPACALKADAKSAQRCQRAMHGFSETVEERDGTAMVKLVADALAAALPRYLKAAEGQSHA